MRIKSIEARIARLEAARGKNPLERLSDDELERMLVDGMNTLAADHGGDVGAMITALEASPEPLDREVAAGFVAFIEMQRRDREHREWTARMVAQQGG